MRMSAEDIIKRKRHLRQERSVWETHWQDLADYILPRKNEIVTRNRIKGRKKNQFLYDNTAMNSCETLANSLHGMLTSPNNQWFELMPSDPALLEDQEVVEYLQDLTRRLHRILNNSNFQTEIHEVYLDLCCFGTAAMFIEEDEQSIVRFSARHIAEIFIVENNLGFIEEVHRCFKWDARKIIQEFAKGIKETDEQALEEKVGKKVVKAFKEGKGDKFEITHSVYRESLTSSQAKPFISQYILDDEKKELRQKGFRSFPYVVPRWSKASGESYGRSPGMNALPEAKTLSEMTKTTIKGAQKTVDPPVQLPDDGFVRPFKTKPGSVNYYRAGSNDRAEAIFNDARIDFGFEAMNDKRQRIEKSFFIDKLQLRQGDRMTTVEVNQRVEEQLRLLGPTMGRQHSELLRPLITRLLDIAVNRDAGTGDLLGQVPEAIQDVELDVGYSSAIARAQRVSEGQSILRAVQASEGFLQMDPKSVDVLNADEAIKENFRVYGAPQKLLRSKREVEMIRDARQRAQQQALQQQRQQQEAETINKAGPTFLSAQGQGQSR